MKKINDVRYENVYDWKVIDEIKNGEKVYVIDKAECGTSSAIRLANNLSTGYLLQVISDENENNRYEFFKVVGISE